MWKNNSPLKYRSNEAVNILPTCILTNLERFIKWLEVIQKMIKIHGDVQTEPSGKEWEGIEEEEEEEEEVEK